MVKDLNRSRHWRCSPGQGCYELFGGTFQESQLELQLVYEKRNFVLNAGEEVTFTSELRQVRCDKSEHSTLTANAV